MAFRIMQTADLASLAHAGGGFRLEAAVRSTEDLVQIASAAAGGGARVVLAGMGVRPLADMLRIANAGGGNVFFED